ncbi:hypothetical protein ACFQZ8_28365 [Micromonospora azadirachtae]|uniref:Uncharacterized protein n=1 Tax=Micromonospora azadirachtae TaxID=1970735 RepID=A0ABW3AAM9_9ACTN
MVTPYEEVGEGWGSALSSLPDIDAHRLTFRRGVRRINDLVGAGTRAEPIAFELAHKID